MLNNVTAYADHVVNFKYILFDVNSYPEDMLIRASNLIASIFALDQKMCNEALVNRLRKMVDNLKNLKNEDFRQLVIWIKQVLKGREEGKVLTAKAVLEKGLAVELIAEITGLPLEEILKLQNIRHKT